MKFFHVYNEECFQGWVKNDMINKNTGFKIQNVFSVPKHRQFNNIAAKGGAFYNLIREGNFPFYIDRIAGGITYFPYQYDKALLREYTELLGDWFLGCQLHESGSNRRGDWQGLIGATGEKGPYDLALLKERLTSTYAVTPEGEYLSGMSQDPLEVYAKMRYAETPGEYIEEMKDMFRRRMEETDGHIIPCDSYYMATKLQDELGMKTFMPEVGWQIPLMRVQVALARGVARASGKTWGTYYECWRQLEDNSYSMPCFNNDPVNEWYLTQETHPDNFTEHGANGGSSRLLQNRIYYYSLMSGAHYFSEEWGLNCSFTDMHDFTLSEYGQLKKAFIHHTEDILGVEAVTPFAIVLPKAYSCVLVTWDESKRKLGQHSDNYMECILSPEQAKYYGHIQDVLKLFFGSNGPTYGNESHTLTNSRFGDVFDIIYEDASDEVLSRYAYLIDATKEGAFIKAKAGSNLKILDSADLGKLEAEMKKLIPAVMPVVADDLCYMVSTDDKGVRYLSIFNNEGNTRSLQYGNVIDPKAERTVHVTFNVPAQPKLWKSAPRAAEVQKLENSQYAVEVPAAGFTILTF